MAFLTWFLVAGVWAYLWNSKRGRFSPDVNGHPFLHPHSEVICLRRLNSAPLDQLLRLGIWGRARSLPRGVGLLSNSMRTLIMRSEGTGEAHGVSEGRDARRVHSVYADGGGRV